MSKLSFGDTEALRTFFNSSLTANYRSCIAAQSYEPKGAGYDPSTDAKLARLVLDGVRHGKSDWARMKRVLDHLSDVHVEVLRLVVSHDDGVRAIGTRMPRALAAGRGLAEAKARERALLSANAAAGDASPMTIATRVLEADKAFRFDASAMTVLETQNAAHQAIEAGLVDVTEEATAIVASAVEAFHGAQALAGRWRSERNEREDARRSSFRDSLRAERESKAAARFDRRLQSAS